MLAPEDFALKVMLLAAATDALEAGELSASDWRMTDADLIASLLSAKRDSVGETAKRWMTGDLWTLTNLYWVRGEPPSPSEMRRLTEVVGTALSKPVFCYSIPDRRQRALRVLLEGHIVSFGTAGSRWLFGAGSPVRKAFSSSEERKVVDALIRCFRSPVSVVGEAEIEDDQQELFV
jgi:hypothetical protein